MTLELMVSGLCAFVRKSCMVKEAKELHVLMIEHGDHEPKLIVNSVFVEPMKDGEDAETYSPDEIIEIADGQQLFVWNLRGFRLDFADAPAFGIREGSREYNVQKPDTSPGATKNRLNDFSWIPELHLAKGTTVDQAHADPSALDQDALPSYACSRFMGLAINPTDTNVGNWIEAAFAPLSETRVFKFTDQYSQVLAERVRMTIQSNVSPTLLLYSYDLQEHTRRIRFKEQPLDQKLAASVSNLPSTLEFYNDKDPLKHFVAYYSVLEPDASHHLHTGPQPSPHLGMSAYPVKCTLCSTCGGQ